MATFTATAAQANVPAIMAVNRTITRVIEYTQSASLSIGDVIQMMKIPNGAIVSNVQLQWSVSAGVTGVTIGDGNDISAYASNTLVSGSVVAVLVPYRGSGRSYSAEDTIDITVFSVSATPANCQLKLIVSYSNQN